MGTRTFLVLIAILFVLLGANAHFAVASIEAMSWFWLCLHLFAAICNIFLIFAASANRRTVN
jgi:hypothetical protein